MPWSLEIYVSLFCTTCAWLLFLGRRNSESIFSPLFLFLVFHTFVFVFRPLVLDGIGSIPVLNYMRFVPTDDDLNTTYLASAVAVVAYAMGSQLCRLTADANKSALNPIFRVQITHQSVFVVWITLGMIATYSAIFVGGSILGGANTIETERVGAVTINVNQNGYLLDAQFMLVGLCVLLIAQGNFRFNSFLPLLLFFSYRTFVGWGRWTIVLTCFAVYSLYLTRTGKRWPGIGAAVASVGLFTLFTLLGQDREFFRSLFTGVKSSNDNSYQYTGLNDIVRDALSGLDFGNFEYLTYIVRTVPKHTDTFTYGLQHLQIFTEPIPRALWSGKPAGAPISFFDLNDYGNFFGLTNSLIGDGWLSGGMIGVAITLFITGYLLEKWHVFYLKYSSSNVVGLLYVCSAALLVQLFRDGSLVAMAKFLTFALLPIMAAAVISLRSATSGTSVHHA